MPPGTNRPALVGSEFPTQSRYIVVKSGLEVDTQGSEWILLPNSGRGRSLKVGWVYNSEMSQGDKDLILEVVIHYARTKAASTTDTVLSNIKPVMIKGIPSLVELTSLWSSFPTSRKKGVNQFFRTLKKLGYSQYAKYHNFTCSNLDKSKSRHLDSSRGAFSNIEFDSLARCVNLKVRGINWATRQELIFFQSSSFFGQVRNIVTNKLILATVRRPAQIALLKWSDLIPVGATFSDAGIERVDEIGWVATPALQLRVFHVKSQRITYNREVPERYPIYLSEEVSNMLIQYKKLVADGIGLLLDQGGLNLPASEILRMMDDMPMFPDTTLFDIELDSLESFRKLFTPRSSAYHVGGASVAQAMMAVKIVSERTAAASVSSNRIRHTVLTRGAQDGLDVTQLAKITGVTVPAARHYIDLDYAARRMIDEKYIGNIFLQKIFCTKLEGNPDLILNQAFDPVGSSGTKELCETCSALMGRPLGCYGCPNFRPILEADHTAVLKIAEDKLAANKSSLVGPLNPRSLEKLERQVLWLKFTIAACDEIMGTNRAIKNE